MPRAGAAAAGAGRLNARRVAAGCQTRTRQGSHGLRIPVAHAERARVASKVSAETCARRRDGSELAQGALFASVPVSEFGALHAALSSRGPSLPPPPPLPHSSLQIGWLSLLCSCAELRSHQHSQGAVHVGARRLDLRPARPLGLRQDDVSQNPARSPQRRPAQARQRRGSALH
jgi:hypothetical protein